MRSRSKTLDAPARVKPDLVLIGDMHIGDLHPECRSDSYRDALRDKLVWIQEQWLDVPKVTAGDVFDHWKQPPEMITFALRYLPQPLYSVRGQHDLPNHSMELAEKSAFQTLVEAKAIIPLGAGVELPYHIQLQGYNWGEEMHSYNPEEQNPLDRWIGIIHVTVWEKPFAPGQDPGEASRYLKVHPGWDLILTGDNHQEFVVKNGNRLLVNPGSLMRMRADQIDHRPCVFLYYAKDNRVEHVDVPMAEGVISRAHIEQEKVHEAQMSSFIRKLESGDMEVGLSFTDNMAEYLRTHSEQDIDPEVRKIIAECMG